MEKRWEVAECAVSEFPPNWRPSPWTNSVRVCLSTAACVRLPGQEIPGAGCWLGRGVRQQADVTDPPGPRGSSRARRVMTGPASDLPIPQQGSQAKGNPGPCFLHLCSHTERSTRREGIHTLRAATSPGRLPEPLASPAASCGPEACGRAPRAGGMGGIPPSLQFCVALGLSW